MFCRKCGVNNADEAQYCVSCGEQLQPVQQTLQRPYYPPDTVPNYLVWSILATVLCCLIPGIVAIVYSAQVNSRLATGDYEGAVKASNSAKTWAWVSFGLGILYLIACFAFGIIGAIMDPGN